MTNPRPDSRSPVDEAGREDSAPHLVRVGADLLSALRRLARKRGFSGVAILSLLVGIGASVVLFSLVRSILWKPLAYSLPEQLVVLREATPRTQKLYPDVPANILHVHFWQQNGRSFKALAAFMAQQVTLEGRGEPQRLDLVETSADLFSLLGVRLGAGRSFLPEEEQPGRNRVIVITDHLWRQRFGASRDALGQSVRIDGVPHTLIGILPPTFRFPRRDDLGALSHLGERVEIFRPLGKVGEDWMGDFGYNVLARLRPGVSQQQALSELDRLQATIGEAHHEIDSGLHATVEPLQEVLTAPFRTGLYALFAAVGLLLLLVLVNLANLVLAAWSARTREIAVRTALGASTALLAQQVVAETLVLALAGGAAGTLAARVAMRVFLATVPVDLPRLDEVKIDALALLFALGLVVVCGVLAGLFPAVSLARSQTRGGLRGVSPSTTAGRGTLRLRGILIGSEVALSALLLILAGLLTSSLWHLQRVDKGFTAEQAVVVDLNLPPTRYPDEARSRLIGRLLDGVRDLPGARGAAFISKLPLSGEAEVNPVIPDGAKDMALDPASHDLFLINVRFISPEYLQAIGLPLKAGRALAATDRGKAVALVSERLAAKVWPGRSPLGHRFSTFSGVGEVTVVGVVADVHATGLDQEVTPCVYVPYWQAAPTTGSLLLRTAGAPAGLMQAVRARIAAIDPALSIPPLRTLGDVVADAVAPRRFEMQIAGGFAAVALFLACLGVYGVVAQTVAERRAEMGIRIALGSPASGILRLVLGKGLRPVAIGLVTGIVAALFAGRLIRSLLFGVSAADPLAITAAALLLLAIATLACLVPALAAGRTDPVRILRE